MCQVVNHIRYAVQLEKGTPGIADIAGNITLLSIHSSISRISNHHSLLVFNIVDVVILIVAAFVIVQVKQKTRWTTSCRSTGVSRASKAVNLFPCSTLPSTCWPDTTLPMVWNFLCQKREESDCCRKCLTSRRTSARGDRRMTSQPSHPPPLHYLAVFILFYGSCE